MRVALVSMMTATLFLFGCGGTASVSVTLTDAPVDDAEKVEVTLADVSVHFVPQGQDGEQGQAGDEEAAVEDPETAGWHSVLTEEATYDLLVLKDNPVELGVAELGEGKITQIRLWLSETTAPTITIDGTAHEMTVPSGKIKLVRNFDVVPGEELGITLDFDAAASVTQAGNGDYKLQPTIQIVDDAGE